MTNRLTKMTEPGRHRLWAELVGDSTLDSLRFATLGWVPRKLERVRGSTPRYAFCLLARGSGTFLAHGATHPQPVSAPGVFFTSPGMSHDYGASGEKERWEEYYWILEGTRLDEWRRAGWWPDAPRYQPIEPKVCEELVALFRRGCSALERRERSDLDEAKLALEHWFCLHARTISMPPPLCVSPISQAVEAWRREPQRQWSLQAAARNAGMSYTCFRRRFLEEQGTSPYDYLLRLRLELAARWLCATDEPIKAIAQRCGFGRVETFVRAFGKSYRVSPGRWRAQQAGLSVGRGR